MKIHFVAILCVTILSACSEGGAPSNANHAGHANMTNHASNAADHNSMQHGSSHSNMQSSPGASEAAVELQFLDTMIAHHQGAVDMALLAEARASGAEVKELTSNIINDQEREIAKMAEWRNSWYEGKPAAINMNFPGMSHGMGGMDMKKLESLKGKEFDREFLKQMIPHHEGAIEMAKEIQKQDSRLEVKELAGDIIKAQEDEIKDMQEWLRALDRP